MRALKWLLPCALFGVLCGFLASTQIGGVIQGQYPGGGRKHAPTLQDDLGLSPAPGGNYAQPHDDEDLENDEQALRQAMPDDDDETGHGLPAWLFQSQDDENGDDANYGPAPQAPQIAPGSGVANGASPEPAAPLHSQPAPRTTAPRQAGASPGSQSAEEAARQALAAAQAVRAAEAPADR